MHSFIHQFLTSYIKFSLRFAIGIPLDTQWADIDYMQNYRDFTTDSVNFPTAEVKSFVNQLHTQGQHFVPIIDPGIMVYKVLLQINK